MRAMQATSAPCVGCGGPIDEKCVHMCTACGGRVHNFVLKPAGCPVQNVEGTYYCCALPCMSSKEWQAGTVFPAVTRTVPCAPPYQSEPDMDERSSHSMVCGALQQNREVSYAAVLFVLSEVACDEQHIRVVRFISRHSLSCCCDIEDRALQLCWCNAVP